MKTNIFLFLVLSLSFFSMNVYSSNKNNTQKPFIVVLDAGHGGKDPGNRGNGFKEKDIVLDVTLQVGKILENTPGFEVLYTRTTDVFIELKLGYLRLDY